LTCVRFVILGAEQREPCGGWRDRNAGEGLQQLRATSSRHCRAHLITEISIL
jgi:hypothetical protein